jgi:hypothetical protein
MTCLKTNQTNKLRLKGVYGSDEMVSIVIYVNQCKNDTTVICKSQDVIDKSLNGGYLVLDFVDNIFDPTMYDIPEKKIKRDFYTTMSNKFYKTQEFYFKNLDYKTDVGFLTEDFKIDPYLIFSYYREMYDFRVINSEIFKVNIRLDTIRDVQSRKYLKIQDVIAQTGGLIKGITFFTALILYTYSKLTFYEYLIAEYNFEGTANSSDINNGELISQTPQTRKNSKKTNFEDEDEKPHSVQNGDLLYNGKFDSEKGNAVVSIKHEMYQVGDVNINKFQASKQLQKKNEMSFREKMRVILCYFCRKRFLERFDNIKKFYEKVDRVDETFELARYINLFTEIELIKKRLDNCDNQYCQMDKTNRINSPDERSRMHIQDITDNVNTKRKIIINTFMEGEEKYKN